MSPIIKSPAESVQDGRFFLKVKPEPELFVPFSHHEKPQPGLPRTAVSGKMFKSLKVL